MHFKSDRLYLLLFELCDRGGHCVECIPDHGLYSLYHACHPRNQDRWLDREDFQETCMAYKTPSTQGILVQSHLSLLRPHGLKTPEETINIICLGLHSLPGDEYFSLRHDRITLWYVHVKIHWDIAMRKKLDIFSAKIHTLFHCIL